MECKKDGKRYWKSLDKNGNTAEIYCKSKDLVAYTDFKDSDENGVADDTNLYTKMETIPLIGNAYDISSISNVQHTLSAVGSCPP